MQSLKARVAKLPACVRQGRPARRLARSRSGGIGRHAWFRAMWPQGCRSSSLLSGTSCWQAGALASGASGRDVVQVRVLSRAQQRVAFFETLICVYVRILSEGCVLCGPSRRVLSRAQSAGKISPSLDLLSALTSSGLRT